MTAHTLGKEVTDRRYRLLPSVFEHMARVKPERVYAAMPRSVKLEDGLREVTFGQVLRATNAFALYLKDHIGSSTSFEALTYVGVHDLRYVVFFFACIKTGHKVSLLELLGPPSSRTYCYAFCLFNVQGFVHLPT